MIGLDSQARIWLCTEPTDMRKSFRGLSVLVRNQLKHDPLSGSFNKSIAKLPGWMPIHNCATNPGISAVFKNHQALLGRQVVIHERKTPGALADYSLRFFAKKCGNQGEHGSFTGTVNATNVGPVCAIYSERSTFNLIERMVKYNALQAIHIVCGTYL